MVRNIKFEIQSTALECVSAQIVKEWTKSLISVLLLESKYGPVTLSKR